MPHQSFQHQIKIELQELRNQLILEEVIKEWDDVCFQYGLSLLKPTFSLIEATNKLGEWEPLLRRLSLSQELVNTFSWDTVVNVLKHEMAHQIVSEVYRSEDLHGEPFQKACDRLGLIPPFRMAHLRLDALREAQQRTTSLPNRLKRRLEKLEAMTGSSNRHEAELAFQRLNELRLHAHGAFASDNPFYRKTVSLQKKRVSQEQSLAASLLSAHFQVEVIYSNEFDCKRLERTKTLVLLGRRHHVEMAEYVFAFLMREIRNLWKAHRNSTGCPSNQRSSYQKGVLLGFEKGLTQEESTAPKFASARGDRLQKTETPVKESRELLVTEKRELNSFLKQQFPKLRTSWARHGGAHNRDALSAGRQAGAELSLKKPLTGNEKRAQQPRLLCDS